MGWVSDPIPAKFGKYGKKTKVSELHGGWVSGPIPSRSSENIAKNKCLRTLWLAGCLVTFPREVRKIWQKAKVSELHGGWVSGPISPPSSENIATKQRSPNFMVLSVWPHSPAKFGKYCKKTKASELHGGWVSGAIPPRTSENIAKNICLRTSWGLGV